MHATVTAFIAHLRSERNASVHTVRSYEDDLALFCRYLDEELGEGADPSAADARRLRRYSAWLSGQGYASSTIAQASEPAFVLSLSATAGGGDGRPGGGLRNPKQPQRLPRLLRVEDVIRLLDEIPTDDPLGVRDRAMFETLYGGGLRVSELVGLDLGDLDLEEELIRVRGKGRRERLCPIGRMAADWIEHWRALRQPARRRTRRFTSTAMGRGSPRGALAGSSRPPGHHWPRQRRPAHTPFGTASPPICSTAVPTCEASRSCSATEI